MLDKKSTGVTSNRIKNKENDHQNTHGTKSVHATINCLVGFTPASGALYSGHQPPMFSPSVEEVLSNECWGSWYSRFPSNSKSSWNEGGGVERNPLPEWPNRRPKKQKPTEASTARRAHLHYITCHLADAFIQSDLQLIRLSRRHSPLEHCGVKGYCWALLEGPTAVQILSWPHQGSNHRPCGSKSSSLITTLQAASSHTNVIRPVTAFGANVDLFGRSDQLRLKCNMSIVRNHLSHHL